MLPQSLWCAAWSAATRSIVSLEHSSHHWLIPGVSAIWVLALWDVWVTAALAVPVLDLESGTSHLKAVVAVPRATWGMPSLILLTAVLARNCPTRAGSHVPAASASLPVICSLMAAFLLTSGTRTDRIYTGKTQKYFRPEIFLNSSIHVKIKSSYVRWPKQLLKLVYQQHHLLQHIFTVPCRWSITLVKLKVAWDQPWNSQS